MSNGTVGARTGLAYANVCSRLCFVYFQLYRKLRHRTYMASDMQYACVICHLRTDGNNSIIISTDSRIDFVPPFSIVGTRCWCRVVHGSDGPVGRVGSGRIGSGRVTILPDFGGSGRVGSALGIYQFFTDHFLVPESIWIFEYYIRIDWFSSIFNIYIAI